jgi:hypothetical protein
MGGPEFTPAQIAATEKTIDEIIDGRRDIPPVPVDQYVGKTPAEIEARDAVCDAETARLKDQINSATERRILLLEEQLRANNELVQKLAKDQGGYSRIAAEVTALNAEQERRRIYARITANGGMCTISVHSHEDPAQNYPVDVGVNGRHYRIPRGVQTIVPVEVLEVLDHARLEAWVREVDENGNPRLVRHERMSYPYSLIDYSGQRLEAA